MSRTHSCLTFLLLAWSHPSVYEEVGQVNKLWPLQTFYLLPFWVFGWVVKSGLLIFYPFFIST
ncbi:MAG: hypothetical protein AB7F59_13060, partial [Bdellovibrionales bacterium]